MSIEISTDFTHAEDDYERIIHDFTVFRVVSEDARIAREALAAAGGALVESLKSCVGQRFNVVGYADSALVTARDGTRDVYRVDGHERPPQAYLHIILADVNDYFAYIDVREFDDNALTQKLEALPENQKMLRYGYRFYMRDILDLRPTAGLQETLFDLGPHD